MSKGKSVYVNVLFYGTYRHSSRPLHGQWHDASGSERLRPQGDRYRDRGALLRDRGQAVEPRGAPATEVTPAYRTLSAHVTEAEFMRTVIEMAHAYGYVVAHFRPANPRRCS